MTDRKKSAKSTSADGEKSKMFLLPTGELPATEEARAAALVKNAVS